MFKRAFRKVLFIGLGEAAPEPLERLLNGARLEIVRCSKPSQMEYLIRKTEFDLIVMEWTAAGPVEREALLALRAIEKLRSAARTVLFSKDGALREEAHLAGVGRFYDGRPPAARFAEDLSRLGLDLHSEEGPGARRKKIQPLPKGAKDGAQEDPDSGRFEDGSHDEPDDPQEAGL